jgi:hypothetical protein
MAEDRICQAILALEDPENENVTNVAEAARWAGVGWHTMNNRMKGILPPALSHVSQQNLTPSHEETLAKQIKQLAEVGQAPTRRQVLAMAARLAWPDDSERAEHTIPRNWISRFIKRNPSIKSMIGQKLESTRAKEVTQTKVLEHLERFKMLVDRYNIERADIFNMDETGMVLGENGDSQVLGPSTMDVAVVDAPASRESCTIIECISAEGHALPPYVIFRGKSLQHTWFQNQAPDVWRFSFQENGWTNTILAIDWLEKVFLSRTAPSKPGGYRLLVMDNHNSHCSPRFKLLCRQHLILTLYLPPHSSHISQPLDLADFGPLKTYFRQAVEDSVFIENSARQLKLEFIKNYDQARQKAFKKQNIESGFRAAGLVPYNRRRLLEHHLVVKDGTIQDSSMTTPPRTAPPPSFYGDSMLSTPNKREDWYLAVKQLHEHSPSSKGGLLLGRKMLKTLDGQQAQIAELKAEISRLKAQLALSKMEKTKRQVKIAAGQVSISGEEAVEQVQGVAGG